MKRRKPSQITQNGIGEIERIPVPATKHGKGLSAALKELKPGECRILPIAGAGAANLAQKMFGAGNYRTKKVDAMRTRVWRLA